MGVESRMSLILKARRIGFCTRKMYLSHSEITIKCFCEYELSGYTSPSVRLGYSGGIQMG
jgi:hypothetical protein